MTKLRVIQEVNRVYGSDIERLTPEAMAGYVRYYSEVTRESGLEYATKEIDGEMAKLLHRWAIARTQHVADCEEMQIEGDLHVAIREGWLHGDDLGVSCAYCGATAEHVPEVKGHVANHEPECLVVRYPEALKG